MRITCLKSFVMLALAVFSALAWADPPARVGRISYAQGDVIFRNNADGDSLAAQVNWPVTSQNTITTARGARAEIRVGSTAVRIDGDTELEIAQLDDTHFRLNLIYGGVIVRIKDPDLAQQFSLQTPQGRVLPSEPSRMRVDTDRAPNTTVLAVGSGAVHFESVESSFALRAGKRAEVENGTLRITEFRPNEVRDDFDAWALAREHSDDRSISAQYVSPETTGYEDLDRYGSWQVTPSYGPIWYPSNVAYDWAPYSVGRWTWIAPWGWTWVDSAPWGYAPFHYGRWVRFNNRWCWSPGVMVARPVWAPALVAWVGGPQWSASFSVGAAPAVGWFPLAPREVYVPGYAVSPTYLRRVNITHVTHITNVTTVNGAARVPPPVNFQNRHIPHAVSVMPHDQFIRNRTIAVTPTSRHHTPARVLQNAPLTLVAPAPALAVPGTRRHRDERVFRDGTSVRGMPDMHIDAPATTPPVRPSPGRRAEITPSIVTPTAPAILAAPAAAAAQSAPLRVVPPPQGTTERSPHAPQKFYRPGPSTAAPEAAPTVRQPAVPPTGRPMFESIPRAEPSPNRAGDAEQHRRAFELQRRSNLANSVPQDQKHEQKFYRPGSSTIAPEATPTVRQPAAPPTGRQIFESIPRAEPSPNRTGDAEQHRRAFEVQRRSDLARSVPQEQKIEATPARGHERRASAPAIIIPQAAPHTAPQVKAVESAPQVPPVAAPKPDMHHGGIGKSLRHGKDGAQPEAGQKIIEKGR